MNFEFNFIKIGRQYHIAALERSENWWENDMKQIIASVFFFVFYTRYS